MALCSIKHRDNFIFTTWEMSAPHLAASCPERGPVKNIRQEAGCVLESIYMTLREGKFLLQLGINL